MDKELKIKVTGESNDVLKNLSKNLKDAKNEFLLLKQSATATSSELKQAGDKVTKLGNQLRSTKKEVNDLASSQKMSKFQLLEFGENLTVVTAGLVAAGTAAVAFGKKIYESASKGAEFEVLFKHFQDVNGGVEEANKNLELFRKASTGNLSTEELVAYSNGMSELGFSTKTTAQLLDVAEKQGDKVGVTFGVANEKLQKFILTGSGKGLTELKINIANVHKEMERVSGKTIEEIGKLGELEQQTIRTNAITSLYGDTLENIAQKTGDNADIIASLSKQYENFKTLLSVGVANAFMTVVNDIGILDSTLDNNIQSWQNWGVRIGDIVSESFTYITRGLNAVNELRDKHLENALDREVEFNKQQLAGTLSETVGLERATKDRFPKLTSNNLSGNSGKSNSGNVGSVKETTNELIEANKKLIELQKEEATYADKTTLAYFKLTQQIAELNNTIAGLNLPMTTANVNGQVATLPGGVRDNAIPLIPVDPKAKEDSKLLEDASTLQSSISSAMNVLGVGTETFVGTLMSGFNTVLTIMEAIKSVNTILSFIPGFASGGNFAGGSPIMVGERGPEIIFPNTSGYVMNNFNSMQVMKSQQQPIYVGVNLNSMEIYKTGKKDFNSLQSSKRIN